MKKNYTDLKVGILGGGQLARMLVLKGHEMGLKMHVLSASKEDPAAQVTSYWHKGNIQNSRDLKSFLSQVDVATFESEFLPGPALTQLSRETKTPIRPRPSLMEKIQDRWTQKKLMKKWAIPTAEFVRIKNFRDAFQAMDLFPAGMVLKKRRFGYDGYGTFIVKSHQDLNRIRRAIEDSKEGFIAEELIPFKRELAIIVARNRHEQVITLPLVETKQVDSRCFWVKGPVQHKSIRSIKPKLVQFVKELKYEGVMAFELFDTQSRLLVNEIAPRVHNSAHYSLDALDMDQFTLHLRAVLGMDLKKPEAKASGFAMVNLLGRSTKTPKWQLPAETRLHWYGKGENRPGRKMGHINTLGSTPARALEMALKSEKEFQL